jgi:hypothetical protein
VEVAVMSLSAHEQQALDSIEDRLAGSDPKLASLLDTFTRLARGEEMPRRERIRPISWRHRRTRRRRQERAGGPAPSIRLCWQRVMLVLGLVAALVLAAASLAANRGGGRGACKSLPVVACAGQARGHGSRATVPTVPVGLMMLVVTPVRVHASVQTTCAGVVCK